MKVIVIGSSGFIGRNAVEHLSFKNNVIYSFGNEKNLANHFLFTGKIIHKGRFDLNTNWDDGIHIDFVLYLISGPKKSDTGFSNQTQLLHHAINLFVKKNTKFIFFSSAGGIYEDSSVIKSEKMLLSPKNDYEKTKVLLENYLNSINSKKRNIIVLRPSNIYGKYQEKTVNQNGLITTLIFNTLISKPTSIPKNYRYVYRDYLHINDILVYLDMLLKKDKDIHGVFNVSFGKSHSIKEVIDLTKNEFKNFKIDVKPVLSFVKESDNLNSFISNEKISKIFGSIPNISLKEGIKKQIIYLNELVGSPYDIKN